mgnify:CR=1 FL=1
MVDRTSSVNYLNSNTRNFKSTLEQDVTQGGDTSHVYFDYSANNTGNNTILQQMTLSPSK